jgi:hypothetical protein
MSIPNVIIYPQTNNVTISNGTSEETIDTTSSVSVTSFPSVNVITINDNIGISTISLNSAPSSSSSTGTSGEIRFDANFLYICVSTNLWKKISLQNI